METIADLFTSKDPLAQAKKRYDFIFPFLDEKQRRLFVAAEAMSMAS